MGRMKLRGWQKNHKVKFLYFEFYHHERKWIYEQRISLQDNPDLGSGPKLDENNVSSFSKTSSSDECLKSEPSEISLPCITDCLQSRRSSSKLRFSHRPWRAELKPNVRSIQRGLGQPRIIVPSMGHRPQGLVESVCSSPASVLDMFESMMQARLESCHRIDTIIRRAHNSKADIRYGAVPRSRGVVCSPLGNNRKIDSDK